MPETASTNLPPRTPLAARKREINQANNYPLRTPLAAFNQNQGRATDCEQVSNTYLLRIPELHVVYRAFSCRDGFLVFQHD